MFVRVEPTTLTWPVPRKILTSPPSPLACTPHASSQLRPSAPIRDDKHVGCCRGDANTVTEPRKCGLRARNATATQGNRRVAQSTITQSSALARMHGGLAAPRRRCRGQSAYADVGDGAVVEPDEANAIANGDDPAVAVSLRTHAKVGQFDDRPHCKRMRKRCREERTVMSATAQATNATETLPHVYTAPKPCVRPNGRAAAAIAATRRREAARRAEPQGG